MFSIYNCNVYIKFLNLNLDEIKSSLFNLPKYLYKNITRIYIYPSKELNKDHIESITSNGIIEVNSNSCKDVKSLMKLIIHELYHANQDQIKSEFPEEYQAALYEYQIKRNNVLSKIKQQNFLKQPKPQYFQETDYSKEFDDYLLNQVTYASLYNRIIDIFPNPYSMTSIDEYIAVSFEIFLFENREFVYNICPEVSKLIERVLEV